MTRLWEQLLAARAYALFTSDLPTGSHPDRRELGAAVRREIRRHGGARGCAASVAYAYGDHPETAAPRMRWAREATESVFSDRRPPLVSVP